MEDEPALTAGEWRALKIIAEDGDALLFGLEAARLSELGLIKQERGPLKLTELGRAMLASFDSRD